MWEWNGIESVRYLVRSLCDGLIVVHNLIPITARKFFSAGSIRFFF